MNILKSLLLSATLLAPTLVFAQGGNDPVPGIDVIIKREGSIAARVELDDEQLGKVSALKDEERSIYLSKVIPPMINKAMEGRFDESELQKILLNNLLANRCDPCNAFETFSYYAIDSKSKQVYSIQFNLQTEVKREKPFRKFGKLSTEQMRMR